MVSSGKLALLALAVLGAASPLAQDNANVVDLGYVKYKGRTNSTTGVVSWQGIRFAASPEGPLRWQPPVDIEKKNNYSSAQVIDASAPGPVCLQGIPPWLAQAQPQPTAPSEDCLLLNVRRPVNSTDRKLPVFLVIHGGGYTLGSATSTEYLMSLASGRWMSVEIQYRLGGLGFLDGSEVRKHGTANAGLLDQRAALQWVQRHIGAFGGDPDKVTINGASAGGGSVSAQLQLYGGNDPKPPFRAAMAQLPWWQNFHQDDILEKQYKSLLKATGCSGIDCLRKLDYAPLAKGIDQTYRDGYSNKLFGFGDFYYGPSVDGKIITELPGRAFSRGHFSKVPLWTDHDALEGLIFSDTKTNSSAAIRSDLKQLWPAANQSFLDSIDKLYPISDFNGSAYFSSPIIAATAPNTTVGRVIDTFHPGATQQYGVNPYFYKRQQIFGDAFVSCGSKTMAEAATARGVPVWKTVFNAGILIHGAIDYFWLAGSDPNGIFATPTQRRDLVDYISAFVTSSDPNAGPATGRTHWPQYQAQANVLEFNFTKTGVNRDPDNSDRCKFFLQNENVVRN